MVEVAPAPALDSTLRERMFRDAVQLVQAATITAALITGSDAIHPGSGFLSENSYIAEVCEQVGITFIGPTPQVIEQMSDKTAARRLMQQAGLPVIPGNAEPLVNQEQAIRAHQLCVRSRKFFRACSC